MIKGIIFDVDGVVIDTENVHFLAFKDLLLTYGYDLTEEGYKKYFSGKSIKGGITSLLAENTLSHNLTPEAFLETFTRQKISNTVELFKTSLTFFEDTLQFIQAAEQGNNTLSGIGKVISKPVIAFTTGLESILMEEVMKHHNLSQSVDIMVTAGEYARSKPDPECYQLTLSRMKLRPEDVIGVEDSPSGIKALNAAGIFSVGITNTHAQKELGEARIITASLMKLLNH